MLLKCNPHVLYQKMKMMNINNNDHKKFSGSKSYQQTLTLNKELQEEEEEDEDDDENTTHQQQYNNNVTIMDDTMTLDDLINDTDETINLAIDDHHQQLQIIIIHQHQIQLN